MGTTEETFRENLELSAKLVMRFYFCFVLSYIYLFGRKDGVHIAIEGTTF